MTDQLYRRVKQGAAWRYEPVDMSEYKDGTYKVVRIANRRPSEVLARMWDKLEATVQAAMARRATPGETVKAILETVQREEQR